MIPHSRPHITDAELEAVDHVLRTKYLSRGPEVERFEAELADYLGGGYVYCTQSGTAALHLLILALLQRLGGVPTVALPSYVCAAVYHAVALAGATPVLVDIAAGGPNVAAAALSVGPAVPDLIVLPHLFGQPADLQDFQPHAATLIEDCAQSLGATYQQRPVGTFGCAAVFSFYATKPLTCGSGGAVFTRDRSLRDRVADLADYDQRDEYEMRFAYAMNSVSAALGRAQLAHYPAMLARRRTLAEYYQRELAACPGLSLPSAPPLAQPIHYRYTIQVEGDADSFMRALAAEEIEAKRPVFKPLHQLLGLPAEQFPHTEDYHARAVSIPLYPDLTDGEAEKITAAVKKICRKPVG